MADQRRGAAGRRPARHGTRLVLLLSAPSLQPPVFHVVCNAVRARLYAAEEVIADK